MSKISDKNAILDLFISAFQKNIAFYFGNKQIRLFLSDFIEIVLCYQNNHVFIFQRNSKVSGFSMLLDNKMFFRQIVFSKKLYIIILKYITNRYRVFSLRSFFRIIGIYFRRIASHTAVRGSIDFSFLVIDEAYRGKGIGGRLFDYSEKQIRQEGYKYITTELEISNITKDLTLSRGYKKNYRVRNDRGNYLFLIKEINSNQCKL